MSRNFSLVSLLLFFTMYLNAQQSSGVAMDTIPAIKAEMNVNDFGALVYSLPIEVLKGVNSFQPNITLEYNSQSGNGTAGWGWNISGLSSITRGGKSSYIDGMTLGRQYDDKDPFYLDGQRLLKTGTTTFVTEKYSKIKIELEVSTDHSFIIKYPDGKIGRYKEIVPGQHYITQFSDAFENSIHYTYTTSDNTVLLSSISYGGLEAATDSFKVNFIYSTRSLPVDSYRNGILYRSSRYLSEIDVKSSLIAQNDGLYRKYKLSHVKIFDNSTEQLTKVELFNGNGAMMKPLQFIYDTNEVTTASKNWDYFLRPKTAEGLGSVAIGDFFGTGKPYPIYEIKEAAHTYNLWSPKLGKLKSYNNSKKIFSGRSLINNKITENDQFISVDVKYPEDENSNLPDQLQFNFKDYFTAAQKNISFELPGIQIANPDVGGGGNSSAQYDDDIDTAHFIIRDRKRRQYIVADFNNDGLSDVVILQPGGQQTGPRCYFAEIGKASDGPMTPTELYFPVFSESVYAMEFDGDGSPELMIVDDNGKLNVVKLDFTTNTLKPLVEDLQLLNYTSGKTPLILGDYNGDGLTDFIYPTKTYSLEGSSSAQEVEKMENEQLLWWEYITTGKGFVKTLKDYTANNLAYIAPSQRNVIKRSSGWEKFWSGKPDLYTYTEYGNSSVIAADINNDGHSDLVSFKMFGRARYEENLLNTDLLYETELTGSSTANRVFFHQTKIKPDGSIALKNLDITLALDMKISPLSLVFSSRESNNLNIYKNEFTIHDPVTGRDNMIIVNDGQFVEGRLKTVNNGSPVLQSIEYRPMVEKNNTDTQEVYSTEFTNLSYPYFRHKNIGTHYLTYKIHTIYDDKILTKEYRYRNAIQHLLGKGFVGFQKTFSSDPYESALVDNKYQMKDLFRGVYWTINTYETANDNMLSSTTYGSLSPNSVFTRTIYGNTRYDKGNNRYLVLATAEKNDDFLKGIAISKVYKYSNDDNMLLDEIDTSYGSVGASIEKFSYQPEFYNGEHYFFGKIIKIETSTTKDGNIFSTKEENDYNPDGTVLQARKYGNNTLPIITDYTYFPFGEVKTELLSTDGVAYVFSTSYEYDSSKRFLWKKTGSDGLTRTTNTDISGRVISEVSGLGLVTGYKLDNWGNVKLITDYIGNKTTIKKRPSSVGLGGYEIVTQTVGGLEIVKVYDAFDREIEVRTKVLNDQWTVTRKEYDIYGDAIRASEPFFEGDIVKWNTVEYDDLHRAIKHTSFTGRSASTCYEGLKVTVEDGHKKTSKWVDAMGHTIKQQDAGGIINFKYYPNGALKETNYEGIKTQVEIDGWGNRVKLADPTAGTYKYEYDNLSRITKEINPQGGITESVYDSEGRVISENTTSSAENTSIIKNFTYDSTTKLLTKIYGTYNDKPFSYTTYYDDPYFRNTGKKEETPYFNYETKMSYDGYGRVETTQQKVGLINPSYSTVSNTKNIYSPNGILIKQVDADANSLIWELKSMNAKSLTTLMSYGNGYDAVTEYNSDNQTLQKIKHSNSQYTALEISFEYNPVKGLLNSRNNILFGKEETYQYDDLDRLLEENLNNNTTKSYTYDKRGRMTSNSEIGKYNYTNQNYKLTKLELNEKGEQVNADRGFSKITYNSFKLPNEIIVEGKERISYEYSILKTRSASYFGSDSATAIERPNRKFYSSDNRVEIIKEGENIKIITYLAGDAYTSNYIKIDHLGANQLPPKKYFLHRDNQGTLLAISEANSAGTIVERRYFDAWGNLQEALIGNSTVAAIPNSMGWINTLVMDRGYTGHEHLGTVGLIHMNGRLYDPALRRFMSPDNYVQDPYNTQSYNRYGYVFNNPLLYVDTSGEFGVLVAAAIGLAVAVLTNGINNMIHDVPFWYGAGKAGTMGAVSGAITFGIGSIATSSFTSTLNQALFQAGMHGFVGGIMSEADDGNYLSGFASGVVSSFVASGIKGLGTTNGSANGFGSSGIYKAVMVAGGGLSGGLSSTIAGGNFWMGVRQGVITSGLNHLAHSVVRMTQVKPNFSRIRTVEDVLKNKVWISYYAYNNCGDAARAQNLEGGANPVYQDGRVDLYSDPARQSPALDVHVQKAIDIVINNLLNGKPVMAGVMYTHESSPGNANIATNHYINLVGMGIEDGKYYFSYYDNYGSYGTDTIGNRLYWNPNGYFYDNTNLSVQDPQHPANIRNFILTEVRPNR